jgi:hypothetical protein
MSVIQRTRNFIAAEELSIYLDDGGGLDDLLLELYGSSEKKILIL